MSAIMLPGIAGRFSTSQNDAMLASVSTAIALDYFALRRNQYIAR
jgi:hypothetical protein